MKRKDFSNLKLKVLKEKNSYFEHEDFIAGVTPNLRGIYSTGYFKNPLKTKIIDDYSFSEDNTTPEIELANFLSTSINHIQNCIKTENSIDEIASKITFETKIGKNQFDEIAKMRAARVLWSKMIKQFNPKNQDSYALKINTSINNSINIFPVILGGSQSVSSTKTTHLFFEEETEILKTIDPLAGSTFIEKRTLEILNKAWQLFKKNNIS